MGWSTERLRAILVAVMLAATAGASRGQIADMEPYQESTGLTSMAVDCLAQGPDGTLWIGTDNGLFVFDGFRMRRETLPKGAGAAITDLQADRFNRIWIATDTGLYLRREDAGVAHWSAIVDPDGAGLAVWGKQRVTVDEHGTVYAMDRRSRIWTIAVPPRLPGQVVASRMTMPAYEPYAGAYDADGGPLRAIGSALWFGCGHALCRWLDGRVRAWGRNHDHRSGLEPAGGQWPGQCLRERTVVAGSGLGGGEALGQRGLPVLQCRDLLAVLRGLGLAKRPDTDDDADGEGHDRCGERERVIAEPGHVRTAPGTRRTQSPTSRRSRCPRTCRGRSAPR